MRHKARYLTTVTKRGNSCSLFCVFFLQFLAYYLILLDLQLIDFSRACKISRLTPSWFPHFLQPWLHLAQPSHPGQSTILFQLESPSGKCTKLHTVAASNNSSHAMITLLLLVRATYIWVLFFTHIPFVVNHTFDATPTESLQQHLECSVLFSSGTDAVYDFHNRGHHMLKVDHFCKVCWWMMQWQCKKFGNFVSPFSEQWNLYVSLSQQEETCLYSLIPAFPASPFSPPKIPLLHYRCQLPS